MAGIGDYIITYVTVGVFCLITLQIIDILLRMVPMDIKWDGAIMEKPSAAKKIRTRFLIAQRASKRHLNWESVCV